MPSIRLTKENVNRIQRPSFGEVIYWDTKLKGFGLRARPGTTTYIVKGRPRGSTKVVKITIGAANVLTPDQAENQARVVLGAFALGINPNVKQREEELHSLTLQQLFDAYMNAKNLRVKTRSVYESVMRRCFPDWLNKRVTEITKDMVQKRHKAISNAHGPRGKGEAQADQAMRVLRCLMNYASAVYEDSSGNPILSENPVKRLSQTACWNKKRRRQDVIAPGDLAKWYAAVQKLPTDAIRDYLVLCLFTGLRRSEALMLTWKHINFDQRTLFIPEENTKPGRAHGIPLSDFVFELLRERHRTMVRRIGNDYVFPANEGLGHLSEPKRAISNVVAWSGVKFSSHTLRRTFETTAEQLDISHYALKALLNHSVQNDVTGGYIVIKIERLKEPMQKLANYFLGKINKVDEYNDAVAEINHSDSSS